LYQMLLNTLVIQTFPSTECAWCVPQNRSLEQ
jgi:hypothetical protein